MNLDQLNAAFLNNDDEFLEFQNIEKKLSPKRDMHAILVMNEFVKDGDRKIVSAVSHDLFFFGVTPEQFIASATNEIVRDLVRCGVIYDEDEESFFMYV